MLLLATEHRRLWIEYLSCHWLLVIAVGLVWFSFRLLIAGLTWNEFTMALREITIFFSLEMLGASLAVIAGLGAASSHLSVNRVLRSLEP